ERQARVDIGERHDLGLALVPTPAAEHSDIVGDRLLDVDDIAVLDAALASLADVEREGRIIERLAIAARESAVEKSEHAQLAGTREQLIAPLDLHNKFAASKQVHVEIVGVRFRDHQEIAAA